MIRISLDTMPGQAPNVQQETVNTALQNAVRSPAPATVATSLASLLIAGLASIQAIPSETPGALDLWILVNCTYANGQWSFLNATAGCVAWGLQMQGPGSTIHGEGAGNPGFIIWRAISSGQQTFAGLTQQGGWELGWLVTAYRDLVVGGFGIEVDGNGTSPFGRFVHYGVTSDGFTLTGVLTNLFASFSGADSVGSRCWFSGIVTKTGVHEGQMVLSLPANYFLSGASPVPFSAWTIVQSSPTYPTP